MADPKMPEGYEKQTESLDSLSPSELAQFRAFMKANKGKVSVVDRPQLYVCANSHASEAKDAQPDQSGLGKCIECGQPAGQWPTDREFSEAEHRGA